MRRVYAYFWIDTDAPIEDVRSIAFRECKPVASLIEQRLMQEGYSVKLSSTFEPVVAETPPKEVSSE